MNALLHNPSSQKDSWLSLIAEMAGASECGIARVRLALDGPVVGEVRAIVQVQDALGRILGGAEFFGRPEDFRGAMVDVGFSSESPLHPLTVVAFLVDPTDPADAETFVAPFGAPRKELSDLVSLRLRVPEIEKFAA